MGACCGKSEDKEAEKKPLLSAKPSPNSVVESCKAKTIREYRAKNKSELSLIIGQILDVIDRTQKDWWMGQIEGQTAFGWFPSSNVQVIDEKEAIFEMEKRRLANEKRKKSDLQNSLNSSQNAAQNSVTVNAEGKAIKARVIKPYDGQNGPTEERLPLIVGQIVVITEKKDNDWWLGIVQGTNKRGWFPADSVELTEE